ncbi:MAG: RsmD family RNA methyltransferase [Bacteroidales bacterium]|nr:RsmD family RNA methyltransferase [Bacteroidales bacterium]
MTRECIDFIKAHKDDDTARLLLSASRYPDIDLPLIANQIESLRMAKEKWQSLAACEEYEYPPRLNREQASSEATALYKASLAVSGQWTVDRVADLTGGMGIDTLALAKVAEYVDYVERDPALCTLMERNCKALGVNNVTVHCADCMEWLQQFKIQNSKFDIFFIDPARRAASGRKVAAFEDCTPDILQHLDLLQSLCQRLMAKASPMIDINLAVKQLEHVTEVHVVAVRGECKEVLFLCGNPTEEAVIHCVNITSDGNADFSFRRSEEQAAEAKYCTTVGRYLYDPHAALRKGGCFRLIAQRYGLPMLAPGTHLYSSDKLQPDFPGRIFEVLQEVTLNRKFLKTIVPNGKAHVVVRNFPTEASALQKQLGLSEGGALFIVVCTVGNRRTGFLCKQI